MTGVATAFGRIFRDGGVMAWRNTVSMRRVPDALLAMSVQPIMFVLLFAYVFGGNLGGGAYREFLMGGIFAQTVAFNSAFTTIGLANDLQKGIIDRFRSLPMSRLAVVLGRTGADLLVSILTLVIMAATGLVVGWRIRDGFVEAVAGFAVLLLFAFAMSWIGAFIGLLCRTVEVAQSAGLIWLFPFTFISSAFVSVEKMPAGLQPVAEWNPVTSAANAARAHFGNPIPPQMAQPDSWPVHHAALYTVLCALLILAVFVPLTVARYRRVASR